jgi:hypothetical protein
MTNSAAKPKRPVVHVGDRVRPRGVSPEFVEALKQAGARTELVQAVEKRSKSERPPPPPTRVKSSG